MEVKGFGSDLFGLHYDHGYELGWWHAICLAFQWSLNRRGCRFWRRYNSRWGCTRRSWTAHSHQADSCWLLKQGTWVLGCCFVFFVFPVVFRTLKSLSSGKRSETLRRSIHCRNTRSGTVGGGTIGTTWTRNAYEKNCQARGDECQMVVWWCYQQGHSTKDPSPRFASRLNIPVQTPTSYFW